MANVISYILCGRHYMTIVLTSVVSHNVHYFMQSVLFSKKPCSAHVRHIITA